MTRFDVGLDDADKGARDGNRRTGLYLLRRSKKNDRVHFEWHSQSLWLESALRLLNYDVY